MTTGERLVNISTLSVATALEHFINISTGSGIEYVFVPSDEAEGKIEYIVDVVGVVEEEEIKGEVQLLTEVIGTIEDESIEGIIEEEEIKGDTECQ